MISYFPVSIPFIFFISLIALVKERIVLNKNRDDNHSCTLPNFCGKFLRFSPFRVMLVVELVHSDYFKLMYVTSIP